jgi:hypothetical protein
MKSFIRKSVIVATLLLAVTASSFTAQAKSNKLVYDRSVNSSIGIRVENASGATFVIRNHKGAVVHQGRIKNNNKFYIPTNGLGRGSYSFVIGDTVLQEFVIR